MAPYREPAHDIDVSLTKALFHARRHIISEEGKIRALRLPEVAVATDSIITRILAPKTDFFHVETDNGLLDISMYRSDNDSVEFKLGAGLTFAVPASLLERVQILSWEGFSYRAGPPEFAFLPKAVLYPKLKRSMAK
ncbi:MAG: hypothetical protein JSV46_11270, partial [Candidatus Aminicenantes bacterium]